MIYYPEVRPNQGRCVQFVDTIRITRQKLKSPFWWATELSTRDVSVCDATRFYNSYLFGVFECDRIHYDYKCFGFLSKVPRGHEDRAIRISSSRKKNSKKLEVIYIWIVHRRVWPPFNSENASFAQWLHLLVQPVNSNLENYDAREKAIAWKSLKAAFVWCGRNAAMCIICAFIFSTNMKAYWRWRGTVCLRALAPLL